VGAENHAREPDDIVWDPDLIYGPLIRATKGPFEFSLGQ
jgi:hypothetical protein